VDVMIAMRRTFTACLGFEVEVRRHLSRLTSRFTDDRKAVKAYPNFKVVATTLRAVKTATRNDWARFAGPAASFTTPNREDLENPGPRGRRQLRQRLFMV